MKQRVRTARFHKTVYNIETTEGWDGECTSPHGHAPRILISERVQGRRKLEVLIHEALHACNFEKCESVVERTAHDIAKFLWRWGYREKY